MTRADLDALEVWVKCGHGDFNAPASFTLSGCAIWEPPELALKRLPLTVCS